MQSKRSTTFHDVLSALTRWAANALRALAPLPTLAAAPRRWDGAGTCMAVIRGGGTAYMAMAALAYVGPDGGEHLELFRGYSPAGIPEHAAASARIDALAFLLDNPTNARTTCLFIDDPALRREITTLQDSFPTLQLTATADSRLSIAASQAGSRANSVTVYASAAAARLSLHNLGSECRTVIATDASIVPGKAGAGIAAVASDGMVWQDRLPGTCDITWAELKAIHAAITHHPGKDLLVLSDSQGAVAFANGTAIPAQARMRRLAAQIQALRADRAIEITWVRAHNGHPLNEAADAMARHARRAAAPAALAA
ncbi:RNase H family protein [Pseudarthrobacter sp. B4EP4b]|uniref:RNase H family protein n=1 Tax=Pseudarthrobacter sp. B4EP4b TaxID=2590664 RepID=UPI00114F74D9|nr:RNase H family protein [Pseudarthrobacter sp. B4EP4b]